MGKPEQVNCRPSKEGYVDLADGDHEQLAGPYPTLTEARAMVSEYGMEMRTVSPITLRTVDATQPVIFHKDAEWFSLVKVKQKFADVRLLGTETISEMPLDTPIQLSVLSIL